MISREPVRDYVPETWISLILVKREHHLALAHKHLAAGLLDRPIADFRVETKLTLEHIQKSDGKTQLEVTVPRDDNERKLLGISTFRFFLLEKSKDRLINICFFRTFVLSISNSILSNAREGDNVLSINFYIFAI